MARAAFNIDSSRDLILIPFSPVCETDTLEIRAQAYNSGGRGSAVFRFLLDGIPVASKSCTAQESSYAFCSIKLSLTGKAGRHVIKVVLSSPDGEVYNDTAETRFIVHSRNAVKLDGGFIMFAPPSNRVCCDTFRDCLKAFTDDDWRRYISEMHKIEQDCIIMTTVYQYYAIGKWGEDPENLRSLRAPFEGSNLYPKNDNAARDPVAAVLSEASENGQKVFVAVGNNYGYTGRIQDMQELYDRYGAYESFYGWYFALELSLDVKDDSAFDKWRHLEELSAFARKLSPAKPILISPYNMPSERFLRYFRNNDCFDIIMPQDWAGQCQFTIEQSAQMHQKLAPICREGGKHFWANYESFNFVKPDVDDYPYELPHKNDDVLEDAAGKLQKAMYLVPRFRGGGMVGEQGFDQQMKVTRAHVEKIMNFMLTGFFSPPGFEPACGGNAAVKQYNDYVAYLQSITGDNL